MHMQASNLATRKKKFLQISFLAPENTRLINKKKNLIFYRRLQISAD